MTGDVIRVLMLHGFTQSAQVFKVKTRPLVDVLTRILSEHYGVSQNQISFFFPDGPIKLETGSLVHKTGSLISSFGDAHPSDAADSHLRAWWHNLDVTCEYIGLEESLLLLQGLVQTLGPFHTVVGFSQGGALGTMFASWCEASTSPPRAEALSRTKSSRLAQMLASPPQGPLDLLITFCSWRGSMEFYTGFYEPKLFTPAIHGYAHLDTLLPILGTEQLNDQCASSVIWGFAGTHHVPRSKSAMEEVARKVHMVLRQHASEAAPLLAFDPDSDFHTKRAPKQKTSDASASQGSSRSCSSVCSGSTTSSRSAKTFRGCRGGVRVRAR